MKRRYIMSLIIIILAFIFCLGVYSSTNTKEIVIDPIQVFDQKEKVKFISSWGAYDSKAQILKTIFNSLSVKYPNIHVENSSMAGKDFLYILKTDFASGNDPDLFGLWPGTDFDLLVEEGKVADLTKFIKSDDEWFKQFNPLTWDYVTVDNKIYGVPIEIIYEGLFVNKDLFEEYNIKIPSNFEELKDAVKSFNDEGIIPIAYSETPEGSYIYQNMVMKLGGKEDVENPFDENGKIKPCFIEAMNYMKELYDLGGFPNNIWSIDDKKRNELFLDKKAAMIIQGSWLIGKDTLLDDDETIELINFPDMPNGKADSTALIYGCGNGILHVSQRAWDDPLTRKNISILLKELTSPEYVSMMAVGTGFISNVELGEYAPDDTTLRVKGNNLINNSKELVGPVDSFIDRNIWEDIIVKRFPDVLRGEMTPEALFDEVYEKMKLDKEE